MVQIDLPQRLIIFGRLYVGLHLRPKYWSWGKWLYPRCHSRLSPIYYEYIAMRGLALGPLDLRILPKVPTK